jgi:glycosyltransferase involved in cell wall biosynthesis
MKNTRILILVSRLGIGGIQTFVINLANQILVDRDDVEIFIYCHFPEYAERNSNIELDSRIKVFTLVKNPFLLKLLNFITTKLKNIYSRLNIKEWLSRKYYLKLIQKLEIDIVHSNIAKTDELAVLSKKKFATPFVSTCHGSYDSKIISESQKVLMKDMEQFCDKYIYMADKNLTNFYREGYHKIKKTFIPYGFQSAQKRILKNSVSKKVKFCMIARGAEDKGWIQLNEAISILKGKDLDFEVHVAADGSLVKELFSDREAHGLYYYGPVKNSLPIIEKANIGLLPTYHDSESMPFTVIEYLYHSKPVISSNIGAIEYMITYQEKKAGEILELKENGKVSSLELANEMEKYISDHNKIQEDTATAVTAFEKFDMTLCSKNYLDLYESLIVK